jgi:2'-5' RNA ligase
VPLEKGHKRLFIALWPSRAQRNHLVEALQPLMPAIPGNAVIPGNFHITLVFIGSFAESRIAELQQRIALVPMRPVKVELDHFEYWRRPRIVCLAASHVPAALEELVENLNTALLPLGFVPEKRSYRPHLTLTRKATARPAAGLDVPISLRWDHFELVESVSTDKGVRYHPL